MHFDTAVTIFLVLAFFGFFDEKSSKYRYDEPMSDLEATFITWPEDSED